MKHFKYASYVIRHKWYVFIECCKCGMPIRGILHDLSKLLPSEWFPYANYFYGNNRSVAVDKAFDFAWLLHQKRNRHHWQWWMLPEDDGGTKILPMSYEARLEMIADWRGAGKAMRKPNTNAWYFKNCKRIQLHPDTRYWVESILYDLPLWGKEQK